MMKRVSVLGWIVWTLASAAGAQERFSERIAVSEVVVPVRVLQKGRAVTGLTRADFELYDQGERREILGFTVREFLPPSLSAVAPSEPEAATVAGGGRRLLLLFDFSFARRERLARSLRGLRDSLPGQLGPDDRVAVATYGAVSGLNLLVGFTADRERLGLALDAVQGALDAKRQRQREALSALHEARFGDRPGGDGSTFDTLAAEIGRAGALAVLGGPVVYSEEEDAGVVVEEQRSRFAPIRVRVEVDVTEPLDSAQDRIAEGPDESAIRAFGLSLAELGFLLRDAGGQKNLLLLSEGFAGGALTDARSLFYLQKALRSFRDSGWTVHGIDVGGVPGLGETSFGSDSLLFLADGTGGDLVENVTAISAAVDRVLDRTRVVYVLTFQPAGAEGEGEFRKIEVRLAGKRRGLRLYHRPGYYPDRPLAERDPLEQRIDAAGWLLTNLSARELEVAVRARTVSDPMGGIRTPVAVEVARSSLAGPNDRFRGGRVDLQLVALGEGGEVRELVTGELRYGSRDLAGRAGVRFTADLGLPPGSYQLRVLVRDRRREEVYLENHPLVVAAAEAGAEPAAEAPKEPAGEWLIVEAERRGAYFR